MRKPIRSLGWIAAAVLVLAPPAWAQPARLVKDIYPSSNPYSGSVPSDPRDFVQAGGWLFFSAASEFEGRELWKTDGTPGGTQLVRDVLPGPSGSDPVVLGAIGDEVIFAVRTQVWKSDGTAAGTVLLKQAAPLYNGSTPTEGATMGGSVYFPLRDALHGRELWRSDGTPAGTVMVKDITLGPPGSTLEDLTVVSGTLFFFRLDTQGRYTELWKSDGSEPGTVLVKTFSPGDWLVSLAALGNLLIFTECDDVQGCGIWRSDGTGPGTVRFSDAVASSLFVFEGFAYFGSGSPSAAELWRTDGTAGGTTLVKSVPLGVSSGRAPYSFAAAGGRLFFLLADDSIIPKSQLWVTDGTPPNTEKLSDPAPAPFNTFFDHLTGVGDEVYFIAGHEGAFALWKSDGTPSGTGPVRNLDNENPAAGASEPGPFTEFDGSLLFAADDVFHGLELWKSDGTAAGTKMLKDLQTQDDSSFPTAFAGVGGKIFFSATDGLTNGRELWQTDGTSAGTFLFRDLNPNFNNRDGSPADFVSLDGVTIFTAIDEHGRELWKTDGTPGGTGILKDIRPDNWSSPGGLTRWGDRVLFGAFDGEASRLWRTDGTEAGTVPVLENGPGPVGKKMFVELAGSLYFLALSPDALRYELWKTDGTAIGTSLVKSLVVIGSFAAAAELTRSNDQLFFWVLDESESQTLWKSDGTGAGTVPIVPVGTSNLLPSGLVDMAGTLFFAGRDDGGWELWKSDGSNSGTAIVRRIGGPTNSLGPEPIDLTAVGATLFYTADDGVHGRELWKSDGTEDGTELVADILPGPLSSNPQRLLNVDGVLLFAAGDPVHGLEPWRSDGTAEGTTVFQDIHPGPGASLPDDSLEWGRVGSLLLLPATDGETGYELWSLPVGLVTGSAIFPTSGPASGGTTITVGGWGLESGASASIGGVAGTDPAVGSPAYLTVTAPALTPGTLNDAVLTNPGHSPLTFSKAWFADFADVPSGYLFHGPIERIFRAGLTTGCAGGNFCPNVAVTRATMAIFLLRGKHGATYHPPKATGEVFDDVPADAFAADWIEEVAVEGITKGCAVKAYCPDAVVTREQMAAFLGRARHPGILPADPTGVFSDVPISNPLARWVEQLAREGVARGCGGGQFCPANGITRGEMAAFLDRAFGSP